MPEHGLDPEQVVEMPGRGTDPDKVVKTMVAGFREILGDFAKPRDYSVAKTLLGRVAERLAAGDPAFGDAFRAAVNDRIARLVPQPEARERVLTDECDPNHAFWLLVAPDAMIRHYARHAGDRPTTMISPVFLGHIVPRGGEGGGGEGGGGD
jgi:hypothetical protein